MYLELDGRFADMLAVSDPIKDSPPEALASLRGPGPRVVTTTGDGVRELTVATVRNVRQNLGFAFLYNTLGIPLSADVLCPVTGQFPSPIVAMLAMSLSSVSVITMNDAARYGRLLVNRLKATSGDGEHSLNLDAKAWYGGDFDKMGRRQNTKGVTVARSRCAPKPSGDHAFAQFWSTARYEPRIAEPRCACFGLHG